MLGPTIFGLAHNGVNEPSGPQSLGIFVPSLAPTPAGTAGHPDPSTRGIFVALFTASDGKRYSWETEETRQVTASTATKLRRLNRRREKKRKRKKKFGDWTNLSIFKELCHPQKPCTKLHRFLPS